jgi:hypothetical protein
VWSRGAAGSRNAERVPGSIAVRAPFRASGEWSPPVFAADWGVHPDPAVDVAVTFISPALWAPWCRPLVGMTSA